MNPSKATPGPWRVVDELDIVADPPELDVSIDIATCGTSITEFYETAKANAALIALAPTLQAHAQALADALERIAKMETLGQMSTAPEVARAALAAARSAGVVAGLKRGER